MSTDPRERRKAAARRIKARLEHTLGICAFEGVVPYQTPEGAIQLLDVETGELLQVVTVKEDKEG